MTKPTQTLDDLFNELPPHPEPTPAEVERSKAKAADQLAREIRQGLRDANGDWIEQPETDDEDDETEDEDEE